MMDFFADLSKQKAPRAALYALDTRFFKRQNLRELFYQTKCLSVYSMR